MSVLKIKIAAHAACCGTYALIVAGFHADVLYLVLAVAYGAVTAADLRHAAAA